MNIGTEGKTSKIDKKGVALLTQILNSNDNFECHFKDEDKVPNSDGFFVIKSEGIPNRRFDVQIKSTEKINKLKDGTISFLFDTKFINYANKGVTTDPCIIFHPDVKNKKIYYKILSEEFLEKNYFLDTDQSSVSVHFDPINEIINDVDDFYKILDAFTQYKKSFNIKKINIIDYLKHFPLELVKTITTDNGTEFADWEIIEKELNCEVYFCDTFCAWQKGSNENSNGLLRVLS